MDFKTLSAGSQPRLLRYGVASSKLTIKRHPLISKALPTAVGFAFGDCLTQNLNKQSPDAAYDWVRTAKMGALGAVVAGPVGLAFFKFMDCHIPSSVPLAMGVKVLLDQVLGCIMWQAAFLSIHEPYRAAAKDLLRSTNDSLQASSSTIKKRLLPAVL